MSAPEVSVVIPVFNDPEGIRDTLESLLGQSLPTAEYEIIVVDNKSTDNTRELVQAYVARYPQTIKLHSEDAFQGSYAARNRGIRASLGEVLVFLDSDVTVERDYLEKVRGYLTDGGYDYLGCRVRVEPREATLAAKYDAIHAFRTEAYFEMYGFVPTCCLSVRRKLLERIGPFDARLESGGDSEFGRRADRLGARKVFADDLCVVHPARTSLRALKMKRKRLGRGAAQRHHLATVPFAAPRARLLEYLPSNPLRLRRDAEARGLATSAFEAVIMSMFKVPLTWAYWRAVAQESRRLRMAVGAPDHKLVPHQSSVAHRGSSDPNAGPVANGSK